MVIQTKSAQRAFHRTYFTASGARYVFRHHGERIYATRFVDDAPHASTISLTNELVVDYRERGWENGGGRLFINLVDGREVVSTAIRSVWETPI